MVFCQQGALLMDERRRNISRRPDMAGSAGITKPRLIVEYCCSAHVVCRTFGDK